jgi:hypothetical protein
MDHEWRQKEEHSNPGNFVTPTGGKIPKMNLDIAHFKLCHSTCFAAKK